MITIMTPNLWIMTSHEIARLAAMKPMPEKDSPRLCQRAFRWASECAAWCPREAMPMGVRSSTSMVWRSESKHKNTKAPRQFLKRINTIGTRFGKFGNDDTTTSRLACGQQPLMTSSHWLRWCRCRGGIRRGLADVLLDEHHDGFNLRPPLNDEEGERLWSTKTNGKRDSITTRYRIYAFQMQRLQSTVQAHRCRRTVKRPYSPRLKETSGIEASVANRRLNHG